ncbi:hypothetical protein [uncultured Pluralibacter sp.]|nr:hypothetical protein [uncultured Pluralibacter sp.]HEI8491252.1 hypothetical protein [Citrobacter koseri]
MDNYTLTEDQAIALRNFIGEYWTDFLQSASLTEAEAETLYEALGGEN